MDAESVKIDFDLKKQSRAMAEEPRTTANQFTVKCTVRSHHVYKRIWTPQASERLETVCEVNNEHDKYAVAVHLCNTVTTIGHIPREITRTCHFFIKSKGEITGEVGGRRRRCTAPCGGLEVPCLLTFYHRDTRVVEKAKELVTRKFVLA